MSRAVKRSIDEAKEALKRRGCHLVKIDLPNPRAVDLGFFKLVMHALMPSLIEHQKTEGDQLLPNYQQLMSFMGFP